MRNHRPSATAYLIARSVVFVSRDPKLGHLVPPLAAEASVWFMQACSRHAKFLLSAMGQRWFRALALAFERLTAPGILLHYILRKHFLEEIARGSLGEGFNQVVILGAGFDTLALRLHSEFSGVRFIEIDHPATQRVKREALEARHLPKTNMDLLPVDFNQKKISESLLQNQEYRPEADTLFIAEGVLMYLKLDEIDGIFRFLREQGGRKCRFAFTFMEPQANGKINFRNSSRAVDLWLRLRGETFEWGIKRENLPAYLESKGFLLKELATPETFRQRYLATGNFVNIPLAEGEYVCVAERL
jgi:methyltransferase (TIGR00027 family)